MAGQSLAIVPQLDEHHHHNQQQLQHQLAKISSVSPTKDEWQVIFSRFINYPANQSTPCPPLVPLPQHPRYRPTPGTWISSRSSTVSLQVHNHHSNTRDSSLCVSLDGTVLEEHYVRKLQFSWPQLSCVSGYPARGSRVVFVSYKDSADEIQKFAFRFSSISEAETFINCLKVILEGSAETEPLNSEFPSAISSQSVFMPTNGYPSRACVAESSTMTPIQAYSPELPWSLNYETEQASGAKEKTPSLSQGTSPAMPPSFTSLLLEKRPSLSQDISPAMPPSFTSLLHDCCSEAKQAAAQPGSSAEIDLKAQIMRYMEDSSFLDMLTKVEKIIGQLGDDLVM